MNTASTWALKSLSQKLIVALPITILPDEIVKIVKTHAKYTGTASAIIPIPVLGLAAEAANIWTMYLRINKKLGLKFNKNIIKTISSGIVANISSYMAGAAAGSAIKLIPGVGSVAGAIIQAPLFYLSTISAAYVYLKMLCAIAEKNNGKISETDLTKEMNATLKNNRNELKRFIDEAKKEYKK